MLQIPAARKVGRWTGSASYGASTGRAVLAGHIDAPGPGGTVIPYGGAIAKIRSARPGTVIYVSNAAGTVYRFKVVSTASTNKTNLPASAFYSSGAFRLSLITCGGPNVWDAKTRSWHHRDNIVVTAARF